MPTIKLQAREIVRNARRLHIKMERGKPSRCVLGVVARSCGEFNYDLRNQTAKATGFPLMDLMALEMGYEGYTEKDNSIFFQENGKDIYLDDKPDLCRQLMRNRYYKVGKRVAELAGLPPR